ncbi:MAG: hypothetical protein HY721_01310 [Planctomycetes bacterium]|nr:hypothetical protein [Planctomycetota bacterium]
MRRSGKERLLRKVQDQFPYEGFGFRLVLLHVPMVHVRGHWTPEVDFNALSRRVLEALAEKPSRLTGAEVRFIRQSMRMTLEGFARRFGVTHPAVLKWEGTRDEPTAMSWAIEKDIRLEVLRSLEGTKPADFVAAYGELSTAPAARPARLRLDLKRPA